MVENISGGNTAAPASPAPAGGASPTPQTQSAATSVTPAAQGTQTPGSTDITEREGFIPRTRFDEVNSRMTKAEQQVATWKQQYGWAESVDRDQLSQMAEWYGRYQGDPGEFLERAYQEALSHPVHGATVKSRIGRMLASMRAQTPDPEIEPDIPVMNDQGQVVSRTYSADAMKQIVQRAVQEAIGKEVDPLKQDFQSRQAAQQQQAQRQQVEAIADADIQYVSKRPFFAEHKASILKVFTENPSMTLREAADYVLDTQVLPGAGSKAEAAVLSDLKQKAFAQTVSAGTPSGSGRPKFKNFDEAAKYYDAHPEEAAAMAQR